jgi:hypothetical protein
MNPCHNSSMQNQNLSPNQTVTVTAAPVDQNGNPGLLNSTTGAPTWGSSNTAIATVAAASNGLSAIVTAGSTPGVATITVSGFNPSGLNFASTFTVTVGELGAVVFVFTFGTPS